MHYETIQELGRKIRNGEVSPVDVVDASLKRIAALNPGLNAFITVSSDRARASARVAEEEIRKGKWRGPLHGIPVGVKDFYDTKGVRTTGGSPVMKDRVADRDAAAVTRLDGAGAIIVGKTNMDALGMATTGLTSHFGPVHNPWNEAYVSGGSSAGSAVAVATGICYATLDTDAVGSVRLPAACCGVVGFKGSYGLISTRGILGDEPVDDFIRWMAHAGVTTRDARDTALMLDALATHPDAGFAEAVNVARPLRIGVARNFHAGAEIAKAFDAAAEGITRLGYRLRDARAPFGDPSHGSFAISRRTAGVSVKRRSPTSTSSCCRLPRKRHPPSRRRTGIPRRVFQPDSLRLRTITACRPPVCPVVLTAMVCRSDCRS